ncbi:MAG: replication-relaxation family protein [Thermomicrobiales bacterium]
MSTSVQPPTPADEPVLRALARYHYLTAEQIRRLLYGPGVITYARARLKALVDAKLVQRLEMPHPSRTGSAPNVFRLATRGYRFLEELGQHPMRLPGERPYSYLYWRHTLALNDLLIAGELLTRGHPQFSLVRLLHERDLKRQPAAVRLPDGSRVGVVPDAYLQLREADAAGSWQYDLVVELDMGTTEQRAWRRKIQALLAYADGPYRKALGADSLTIAVLSPLGGERAAELAAWTEAALAAAGQAVADRGFRIAGLDPATTAPDKLYLASVWRRPFRPERVSLLHGTEGVA